MGTIIQKLTIEEFEAQYGPGSKTHEYWYGEAIPKGTPTWIHGLLQKILMRLLDDAGFVAASEVELRIDPLAHPKPDVIAVRTKRATEPYPTEGSMLWSRLFHRMTVSPLCASIAGNMRLGVFPKSIWLIRATVRYKNGGPAL